MTDDAEATGRRRDTGEKSRTSASADDDSVVVEPGRAGTERPGAYRNDPAQAPATDEFDWRGWLLVAAVVVAFVVVPWTIIALPHARDFLASLGLGLRDAYLVLPLVPAFGLGAIAVWTAVAARRE